MLDQGLERGTGWSQFPANGVPCPLWKATGPSSPRRGSSVRARGRAPRGPPGRGARRAGSARAPRRRHWSWDHPRRFDTLLSLTKGAARTISAPHLSPRPYRSKRAAADVSSVGHSYASHGSSGAAINRHLPHSILARAAARAITDQARSATSWTASAEETHPGHPSTSATSTVLECAIARAMMYESRFVCGRGRDAQPRRL